MKLIMSLLLCLALVGCDGGDAPPEEVDANPTAAPGDTELVEPTEPTEATEPTPAETFAPGEILTEGPDPFDPAVTPEGSDEDSDEGWQGDVDVDRDTGELTAPGFNDVVDAQQPSWAETAEEAAEVLLQLDEDTGEEQGTVEIDVEGDEDAPTATVTITDLADDSVNAIRYELSFERDDDGLLRFVDGSWSQRCQSGRGHQDFQAELCV